MCSRWPFGTYNVWLGFATYNVWLGFATYNVWLGIRLSATKKTAFPSSLAGLSPHVVALALAAGWLAGRGPLDSSWNSLGPGLLASCCRRWPWEGSGPSMSFFISSRNLLGSILSSQTDPPTLENVVFTIGILTFLKNQRFRSKDGFESVLGLSRAPFGSSWGALGGLLGALWGL